MTIICRPIGMPLMTIVFRIARSGIKIAKLSSLAAAAASHATYMKIMRPMSAE